MKHFFSALLIFTLCGCATPDSVVVADIPDTRFSIKVPEGWDQHKIITSQNDQLVLNPRKGYMFPQLEFQFSDSKTLAGEYLRYKNLDIEIYDEEDIQLHKSQAKKFSYRSSLHLDFSDGGFSNVDTTSTVILYEYSNGLFICERNGDGERKHMNAVVKICGSIE